MALDTVPESFEDLFEKKAFGNIATVTPEGTPHVTPVWVGYNGEEIMVNTVEGRRKYRNIVENPRVGLSIMDPENPYRYLSIIGEVSEMKKEGADRHIDELTKRYMGMDEYPYKDQDTGDRVILLISPDEVLTYEG